MKVYVDKKNFKVFLSVTHKYKRFYVYTGLQTTEAFDGMVFPRSDKSSKIKTKRLFEIYKTCDDYINLHCSESPAEMKMHIKEIIVGAKAKKNRTSFCSLILEYMELKDKRGTRLNYNTLHTRVENFDDKCTLDSIDFAWVESFYNHELDRGRKNNGIIGDINKMKAVFNWARKRRLTNNYPFERGVFKRDKTRKRNLTLDQMRAIRDMKLSPNDTIYRDFFMLGFYLIGMNLSDILDLKKSDYKNGRITYHRNKTGRLYDIKVEPEAKRLIREYANKKKKNDSLLNFLEITNTSNCYLFVTKLNNVLRKLGTRTWENGKYDRTGKAIEEDLTSYWNRHTWATFAAKLDISMEVIGRSLGHSFWDNSITGVYVEYDTSKIDEANRKVIDYLNSDLKK